MDLSEQAETSIVEFWAWVKLNEDTFSELIQDESADLKILDEIDKKLESISEGLTYDFGIDDEAKTIEFVLSAGGLVENIPFVDELAARCPKLEKWEVVKYKQPKDFETIHIFDQDFNISEIYFDLEDEKQVTLYFKDFVEDEYEKFMHISFVLLDHLLGEYEVMTKIERILCEPLNSKGSGSCLLIELPKVFEAHKNS